MQRKAQLLFVLLFSITLLAGCGRGPRAQLVMEADLRPGDCVTPELMTAMRGVLERRLQALHVRGGRVQLEDQGCAWRIVVDWPARDNNEVVARSLQRTGMLELVELGPSANPEYPDIQPGAYVRTSLRPAAPDPAALGQTPLPYPDTVFKTALTGASLKTATTQFDRSGSPSIEFQLTEDGGRIGNSPYVRSAL